MANDQDPFASIGGGVKLKNGGWVPKDHPLALQEQQQQNQQQPIDNGAVGTSVPNGTQPTGNPIANQAVAASSYSSTPTAAPTQNTTNQGTQDVVRNSYLEQATQPKTIDRNDPNVRAQADAFAAQTERARRNYIADKSEALGPYATGALSSEERLATERAGQAAGSFEAELVGRELQNRRDEIQNALTNLSGMLSADQQRALTKELAELNASIQRHGIDTGAGTASSELALKDKLGTAGLNVDMIRALLQNQQFNNELGVNIGANEMQYYLRSMGL